MKKRDFDELVKSIKQAGDIRRGKRKPSWIYIDKEDKVAFREAKAEHGGGSTKSLRELEAELSAN